MTTEVFRLSALASVSQLSPVLLLMTHMKMHQTKSAQGVNQKKVGLGGGKK